jgi:chromosome segregation ATPase
MRYFIAIFAFVALVSCNQKKIDRLQAMQDSTVRASFQKDTTIIGFISAMNEIQENLDSIKTLEKIVSVQAVSGVELKTDTKKQIIEDVARIHDLLKKNKELAVSLQRKLKASNVKIRELEKMISLMTKQLADKDTEIAQLNGELQKLHIDIEGLNVKIKDITAESEKKSQTIKEKVQTIALNMVYYAFGNKKELVENNVIKKEGGVLGIGRSLKMKKDFNQAYFSVTDLREFKQLELNVKKAQLLTTHTKGSFHFTGDKTVEALVIDNPAEFWKASKYLLIVTE